MKFVQNKLCERYATLANDIRISITSLFESDAPHDFDMFDRLTSHPEPTLNGDSIFTVRKHFLESLNDQSMQVATTVLSWKIRIPRTAEGRN